MLTIKEKIAPTWFDVGADDPQTGFLMSPMSSVAWLDLKNEFTHDQSGDRAITGKGALIAVKDTVKDWRNVVDEKGATVKFNRSFLEDLPPQTLLSIAFEACNRYVLMESERKN